MEESISHIPGRENVSHVVIDLTDGFKRFAQGYFLNATIVADKFHVLRLTSPIINKYRKGVTGDKRTHPIRFLFLKNRYKLKLEERKAVNRFCRENTLVGEVYSLDKESMVFIELKVLNRRAKS